MFVFLLFLTIFFLGTSKNYEWHKRKILCNKNSYHSKSFNHDIEGMSTIYQDFENNENVDMSINTVQRSRDSSVVNVFANMQSQRFPLHDITTSNIQIHNSIFISILFIPYFSIFVYLLGTNSNMNNILQTSQSGNIFSAFTNPTPIKRGRGRPRMTDVANFISPQVASGLSTQFAIPKASIPVLKDVTNTVGNINKGGRPRKHHLVTHVTPNLSEGTSTVPIQTGS